MRFLRPRKLLSRPLRLPQALARQAVPGDPRIFGFNAHRDEIMAEVRDRVVADYAAHGQLEFALNEVAHAEVRRLEAQHDEEASRSLDFWRGLMRRVGRMDPAKRHEALHRIVDHIVRDIAGNFDARVYGLARRMVPRVVKAAMKPRAVARDLIAPTRSDVGRLVTLDGDVEAVRRLQERGTAILVPTHSSNLDSLAIGDALLTAGLSPVVYGAGKNLFSNPIVSFFMHNLGAYRVDRRIRARLYKDVLKAYSAVILERGYHSLFFPGGTRSRSGAIEQRLKLGLAGTAHSAFSRTAAAGRAQRMFFVPVTINYELVLEAETLIADYLKDRGRARYIIEDDEFSRVDRWVAFFNNVAGYEGACVLRFGQAMDPFGNPVDADGESHAPDGRALDAESYVTSQGQITVDGARDAGYARVLGERLVEAYQRETVIMSTQLVAHVAYRHLVARTPGLDVFARMRRRGEVVVGRAAFLREIAQARDRLRELADAGRLHMSGSLRTDAPSTILERALAAWRYHRRTVLLDLGPELVCEEPSLLLYYQNRLLGWAEELAGPEELAVAREIARSVEGGRGS